MNTTYHNAVMQRYLPRCYFVPQFMILRDDKLIYYTVDLKLSSSQMRHKFIIIDDE